MAADNVRRIDDLPEYSTPPETDDQPGQVASVRFRYDGHTYTLRRPKMVITMNMLRIKDGEQSLDAGWDTIALLSAVIGYIEEEPPSPDGALNGRAHLLKRLGDPKDRLDLIHLAEPFMDLMGKVFGRPTTQPAASSPRPARTSRGGAAGSRTKRGVTSTT